MKKPSPWNLWMLNVQAATSVMQAVGPRLRRIGLEMKEFMLLHELDAHPFPGDLAKALVTPKPTVTFMVKRLEVAGFVRREMVPDDLRRFRLTLTPSGRKAMELAHETFDGEFGRRLNRLTAAQRVELQIILETLNE